MTKPTRREVAQSWADDLDVQLHWLSAKQQRDFYFKVLQRILEDWSPEMVGSVLFVFGQRYASEAANKVFNLVNGRESVTVDGIRPDTWWRSMLRRV